MPISVETATQNWVITPAPSSPFGVPPRNIGQQQWLLVITGVGILLENSTQGVEGNLADDWRRETVAFSTNDSVQQALNFLMQEFSISPPQGNMQPALSLTQWAPYVAISSGFHKGTDDAGFAVDNWRLNPFAQGVAANGAVLNNVYTGVQVDIAVRNNKAWIYRISYQVTLVGLLAFVPPIQ